MVDGVRPASLVLAVTRPKTGRRGHWAAAMAVPLALLLAPPAHASDYSLLPAVLYGVFGAVFAAARVRGRISVLPWRPASVAGY